jgi:hypothetical protein
VGYKPGPWSVKAYDVIARISGRFALTCFNLLLFTRLKFAEHALGASPVVNKYLLDCSDIINANVRMHRWNGIALCILTVIHVWSILFPCVFHGYVAKVVPGHFEWPLSERTPNGFRDADPETKTMSLQVDDVWRIVEMTVMLGILMPLSVRWLATRWHVGMPLHQIIMVLYFVDIVRRHSHPHSWILNTPFFVLWIVDKVWQLYWRRGVSPKVHRLKLGDDYMVLFWNAPSLASASGLFDTVGPDYALRLNDSSFLEGRHAFTAFQNRVGLNLSSSNANPDFKWSAGTVVRVFRKPRKPQLGKKDPHSHTKRMYDAAEPLDLTVWGPSLGEMSEHVKHALNGTAPVVLVAAGSGIGYTLDALQYVVEHAPHCSLTVLVTTRSVELHAWAEKIMEQIIVQGQHWNSSNMVGLALTGQKLVDDDEEQQPLEQPCEAIVCTKTGRIRFGDHIETGSIVFCQGGAALKETVEKECRESKARFFGGRGGS